ncbi:hypothetical protein DL96DRAFT_1615304 [Flagelloscypha sp. PMI_526]|nr:hypothetical protein DL96DRAFT_1615304 [Flagelloscypha sp. PMI_526]
MDDKAKIIFSQFTALSHIAFDILSLKKLPNLGFIQWIYHQETVCLVVFLVPPLCQWETDRIFDNFVQDIGVKVVLLDRRRLPRDSTLWKYSVCLLDDWRSVWAKGEAVRAKAEAPDPPVRLSFYWSYSVIFHLYVSVAPQDLPLDWLMGINMH